MYKNAPSLKSDSQKFSDFYHQNSHRHHNFLSLFCSFTCVMNSSCHLGNNSLFQSWCNAPANPRLGCMRWVPLQSSNSSSLMPGAWHGLGSAKTASALWWKKWYWEKKAFTTPWSSLQTIGLCHPYTGTSLTGHAGWGVSKTNTVRHSKMSQPHCRNVNFGTPAT